MSQVPLDASVDHTKAQSGLRAMEAPRSTLL